MSDSAHDFYDRQRRVLGAKAMERMQKATVLIVGLGGLGVEVAKNMILQGVRTCYLADMKTVTWEDLSSGFYFSKDDIGKNRVDSCIEQLKELNSYVNVFKHEGKLTEEFLNKISVIVFTDELVHSLTDMNDLARKTNTRFIACSTRGLFGCVFCDMGEEFEVFDYNGEPEVENVVVDISNENPAMVTVLDKDKVNHGLGLGDKVVFSHVEGMDSLNTMGPIDIELGEKTGKYTFQIKVDGTKLPKYKPGTGYVNQKKATQTLKFLPLAKAIEEGKVENYDFGKWDYGKLHVHPLFRTLNDFFQKEKRFPKPYNEEDAKAMLELVKKHDEKPVKDFAKMFSYGCRGNLNPMAALIGGFTAQEVQKAISGKFTPLNQWFYFDALECLDKKNLPKEKEAQPRKCRYDGQIQVFGDKFQSAIAAKRIFMVGAGALGCEYLKNFALMGVGDGGKGEVIVTDMDSIEVSNLNRQFLFRSRHAPSAAETISVMNPATKLNAMEDKVAPETEEVFNDNFWESLDCVVNALDNMKARMYVDSRCVYFGKPLVEAGTLGPKANTQVVIPHLTERYGAQKPREATAFATCTTTNFPYKIVHCIAWAKKALFLEYFKEGPKNANEYLTNKRFIKDVRKNKTPAAALMILNAIYDNLVTNRPLNFEDCVKWARLKFEELFNHRIAQLIHNYPSESKTEGGLPFWTGSKRFPTPLKFNVDNQWELEFVQAMANVRAEVYGIPQVKKEDLKSYDWAGVISKIEIPAFTPKKIRIQTSEDDEEEDDEMMLGGEDEDKLIDALLEKLPKADTFPDLKLNEVGFEKDDPSNYHVDAITAASNNRSTNYKIPLVSKYKAKGIAGRIIPAMVTSTAMITGFGCLEFYKVVQGKDKIEDYRNAYCNLALPSCTQSEPVPPKKKKHMMVISSLKYECEFTEWDTFTVNMGRDVKLKELIEYFKVNHQVIISSLAEGEALLYASFMPNEEALDKTMLELKKDITGLDPKKGTKFLDFVLLAEDEDEEEVDVPDVKYQFTDF